MPEPDRVARSNLILPAFGMGVIFYPFTKVTLYPEFVEKNKKILNEILRRDPPHCVVLFTSEKPVDVEGFCGMFNYGLICSLVRSEKEGYVLYGKLRAKIVSLDRKQSFYQAKVEELPDDPPQEAIARPHRSMMFGVMESIRVSLREWLSKLPVSGSQAEQDLIAAINKRLASIEVNRRELETAYSLPWQIMIEIPTFFSEDFKLKMLKTDNVVDRLQEVAESLIDEAAIFQYAKTLAEPEEKIELEGTQSNK